MSAVTFDEDALVAVVDLVGRTGATGFEVGSDSSRRTSPLTSHVGGPRPSTAAHASRSTSTPAPTRRPKPVGVIHHVAYQLDEIELTHLAKGGTLWLTTWGGLPIHLLQVEEPST